MFSIEMEFLMLNHMELTLLRSIFQEVLSSKLLMFLLARMVMLGFCLLMDMFNILTKPLTMLIFLMIWVLVTNLLMLV